MSQSDERRRLELAARGLQRWSDVVRLYFPSATDDEAMRLLWGATAFPVAGLCYIEGQLQELATLFAKEPDWLARCATYAEERLEAAYAAIERTRGEMQDGAQAASNGAT